MGNWEDMARNKYKMNSTLIGHKHKKLGNGGRMDKDRK